MDNVSHILQIYHSCDPNNTNSVPVSFLINYIKPSVPDNLKELDNLQKKLDPEGNDPHISSSFFQREMSDWIATINKGGYYSGRSQMADKEETRLLLSQSDTFILEISQNNASELSNTSYNNKTVAFEEVIQNLQYQLHKTLKDLDIVRQQLISSEEQNELLSAELSRLNKLHKHKQQLNEENTKSKQKIEEIKVEASEVNEKIHQLSKTVFNKENHNQNVQTRIAQLEDEIGFLKLKLEKVEKNRLEMRKSVTKLEDVLDEKDTEIAILQEVINEFKNKFQEKEELVHFYKEENNLSKDKVQGLENLFQDNVLSPKNEEVEIDIMEYNSPKFLDQIFNPLSPTMNSPVYFRASSQSGTLKEADIITEIFPNASIRFVKHKTSKEELSEISNIKHEETEIKRLQNVLKKQETIMNDLWDSMKHLSQDNQTLRQYKQKCKDLMRTIAKKDKFIESLINTTNSTKEESSAEEEDQNLNGKLQKQETLNSELPKKNEIEDQKQKEVIQLLKDDLKRLLFNLEKEMFDKCTQTDKDNNIWIIPTATAPDSKKTNYSKLQIKLEKSLEKIENMEKELTAEKKQNRVLILQIQELKDKNVQFKENLVREKSITHELQLNNEVLVNKIQKLEIDTKGNGENFTEECNEELLSKSDGNLNESEKSSSVKEEIKNIKHHLHLNKNVNNECLMSFDQKTVEVRNSINAVKTGEKKWKFILSLWKTLNYCTVIFFVFVLSSIVSSYFEC